MSIFEKLQHIEPLQNIALSLGIIPYGYGWFGWFWLNKHSSPIHGDRIYDTIMRLSHEDEKNELR